MGHPSRQEPRHGLRGRGQLRTIADPRPGQKVSPPYSTPSSQTRTSDWVVGLGNKPFRCWSEVFGNDIVAAATINRLVHHAEAIYMKGDSYRPQDRGLGRIPPATMTND